MKTARRAALTFMLPASLLMSAPACAGNLAASDPVKAAPSETARPDSLPQGFATVVLTETSRESLLKDHPFLSKYMDSPDMTEDDRKFTRYYRETVRDAESGTNLLLVSAVGSYFCGTQGCSFFIYRDDGKGYALAKSFTLPAPVIHTLKEGKNLSLIADAADGGQGLWTWGGDKKYHYSGPYVEKPLKP